MNAFLAIARFKYQRIVRPLFFRMDAEDAHHLAMGILEKISRIPPVLKMIRSQLNVQKPVELFGLTFANPVGLAAGFDKNALALPAWAALGFGFVEIGTITAQGQPGNPRPRLFRYPKAKAVINRMGFNNDGADAIARRLENWRGLRLWPDVPVGINIGKSKVTPLEKAVEDYLYSFERLRQFADYFVLNVSSPNTPGLRQLQERDALDALLAAVQAKNRAATPKPVLLKIAPDLAWEQIEEILTLVADHQLAGIIATNTTLDHSSIQQWGDQQGGLSGAPLNARSTEIIDFIVRRSDIPVIAAGGIMDPASAREKLNAGAKLIQLYTGYIYHGPTLPADIVRSL
ncbi:MAG TPA: quinone-dependent dihydroorotate dehydrogenase [Chthoniobacterales bacterium]